MSTPTSTYRLQLSPQFTFADAAAVVPYLAELGVGHVYLSPVLQAAPGSSHGYDVVNHQRLNSELGGATGFAQLVAACRACDLGIVVDIVPNHVHIGAPEDHNAGWFDLLRRGRDSPFAPWFDIEWDAPGLEGKVLVPVLDEDPQVLIDNGAFVVDGELLRYHDHVFPLAAGTADLPIADALTRQHYRLGHWREGLDRLNYRRFFDIATLAGVRVESGDVFGATHRLIARMTRDDVITGLRVDHPDGLADPAGYLGDLAEATGDTWVVVEKILEATEQLPADWRCAGTTGYDALNQALGLLVDTAAETQLTELYGALTGEPTDWHTVMRAAKRDAVERALRPEIARLSRLAAAALGEPPVEVEKALRDLLVALPVYRVYVRPGNPVSPEARTLLTQAAATAAADSDRADLVERLPELLLDGPPEIVIRFQQTSGPVMAKGVEDTAFYRYHRLVALNEVGGDPDRFGRPPTEFHAFCAHLARNWSTTMTALSTHDTKRSEDVRARLAVISEVPDDWADAVRRWSAAAQRHRSPAGPDRNAEYLIWQTLVGAWPISAERALQYTEKATHEAKQHTAWVDPDPTYDDAVRTFLERVLSDNSITDAIAAFVARIEPAARVNRLTQKLVQLTMPGIPDIYQGTELVDLSLVDPDNRRPVDYDARRDLLRTNDDEKLHVVSTALRARRDHPEWFGADAAYTPLTATGPAAEHVIAFKRGDGAVTIATRLSERLARSDGWRDTTLALPDGPWTDLLSGQQLRGSDSVPVGDVLRALPVALLGRKASSQT